MVDEPAAEELPADPDPRSQPPPRHPWRRRVLWGLLALVVLVIGYVGITFVQVWHASRLDQEPQAGAIVVLGAAQYNGRPSPVLLARLEHALALYQEGDAPLLVVTGGRQPGDAYTEATAGYDWLRRQGVPDAAILKEVNGRDTYESLAAVARFLSPLGVRDVILVSDPTHSLRLDGIASQVGLHPSVSPQRIVHYRAALRVRNLARETVAVSLGRIIGYRRLSRLVG